MKYANKFVLVPYVKPIESVYTLKLNDLDREMSQVLNNNSLDVFSKVRLYYKALDTFNRNFKDSEDSNIVSEIAALTKSVVEKELKPEIRKEIQETIQEVTDKNIDKLIENNNSSTNKLNQKLNKLNSKIKSKTKKKVSFNQKILKNNNALVKDQINETMDNLLNQTVNNLDKSIYQTPQILQQDSKSSKVDKLNYYINNPQIEKILDNLKTSNRTTPSSFEILANKNRNARDSFTDNLRDIQKDLLTDDEEEKSKLIQRKSSRVSKPINKYGFSGNGRYVRKNFF